MTRKVHQLVVLSEGGGGRRPVAILTMGDIVKLMAQHDLPNA